MHIFLTFRITDTKKMGTNKLVVINNWPAARYDPMTTTLQKTTNTFEIHVPGMEIAQNRAFDKV